MNKDNNTQKKKIQVLISGIWLVLALLAFLFWVKVSRDESVILNFSSQKIAVYSELLNKSNNDTAVLKKAIKEHLDSEVVWEWSHEKFNRSISQAIGLVKYVLNLGTLVILVLLLSNKEGEQGKLLVGRIRLNFLIGLSIFQIILATYVESENLDLKQRAHDFRAREIQTIRTALEFGLISNEQAWEDFRAVYRVAPQEAYLKILERNRQSQ